MPSCSSVSLSRSSFALKNHFTEFSGPMQTQVAFRYRFALWMAALRHLGNPFRTCFGCPRFAAQRQRSSLALIHRMPEGDAGRFCSGLATESSHFRETAMRNDRETQSGWQHNRSRPTYLQPISWLRACTFRQRRRGVASRTQVQALRPASLVAVWAPPSPVRNPQLTTLIILNQK